MRIPGLSLLLVSLSACAPTPEVSPPQALPVATEEVRADEAWPSYNRTLDGQRYSPLTEITPQNGANLKPACEMTVGEEGGFQTGPAVVGDTMFLTTAHTTDAMNAASGALIGRKIDEA